MGDNETNPATNTTANTSACFPAKCYEYTGWPSTTDTAAEALPTDTQTAIDAINALKFPGQAQTPISKCQAYCQAVQAAEAEKCRLLREKVSYALEAAGCPSTITPRGGAVSGCATCPYQGTYTPPVSTIQFSSASSEAATAGSCAGGVCPMRF